LARQQDEGWSRMIKGRVKVGGRGGGGGNWLTLSGRRKLGGKGLLENFGRRY